MRLKREMISVLFKTADAGVAPTIEAAFASSEAMDRYFVNHDLARKHRLGEDGEIYPKFNSKKFKFYSLEDVTRKKVEKKKGKGAVDVKLEEDTPEDEETKEASLDEILEEERPDADEGDK